MPAIIKPSRLAAAIRTEPVPQGGLITVSAFLLFDFEKPRDFLSEQALWPMVTEQMPTGIFDKGCLKPKGEWIVAGAALAPGSDPVQGMRVTARLGTVEKQLAVFGDRVWRLTERGIVMTEALPFDRMPIDEAHAYGGQRFSENTRGKGHDARAALDAGYDAPLPNVEAAGRLIRFIDDMPHPAHFGPLAPDHAARMRYAGTYDQNWIRDRAPMAPDDFNPLFHCDAPLDQRMDGHFIGDEAFFVAGMTRGGPAGGRLPDVVVRCFVHRPADDSFTEIRMVCDTVTLFPNVTKAAMAFRGLAKAIAPLCEDIGTVMLACEHREAPPRPADYYLHVFRLRTDPEQAYKHALSDFQLLPERDAGIVAGRRAAKLQKAGEDRLRFMENQKWGARKDLADRGLSPMLVPSVDISTLDELPLVALPTSEELEGGDFDIAELFDDIETLDRAIWLKFDRELAGAELTRQQAVRSMPAHMVPSHMLKPLMSAEDLARFPDAMPTVTFAEDSFSAALSPRPQAIDEGLDPDAAARLSQSIDDVFSLLDQPPEPDAAAVEEQFAKACARALKLPEGSLLHDARVAITGMELPGLKAGAGSINADADADFMRAINERLDAIDQTPLGVLQAKGGEDLSMGLSVPDDVPEAEEGLKQAADGLEQATGFLKSLLPGMQASRDDAPLEGFLAELQASLPAAPVEQSGLAIGQALSSKTSDALQRIDDAEAEVAELMEQSRRLSPAAIFPMEAFLPQVSQRFGDFIAARLAQGQDFRGADLAGADLSGVDFSGLDLRSTFFEHCDLRGAVFVDANLEGAVFTEADLEGADLTGARLNSANFSKAILRGARFDGCSFEGSTFINVDMADASFRGATMTQITLIECMFERADMTGAILSDIQVLRGQADGLLAEGATISRVAFLTLPMRGANFSGARLERVSFAEIQAPSATFSRASFDSCAFLGTCDLSDSFFDRITASQTSWNTTNLARSCFLRADCSTCLFNSCDLSESDLRLASFRHARLDMSVLVGSDVFGANFFSASLGACDLTRASLRCANLFLANLDGARLGSCDFTGANLGKTQMEHPTDA